MFHGPVPPLRGSFPVNSLDRFNTHLLPIKIVSHNKPRDIQVIPFKKRFRWLDLGTISSKTFWFLGKMFTICLTAYLLFYLHHVSSVKIGWVIYPTEINIRICYKYYNFPTHVIYIPQPFHGLHRSPSGSLWTSGLAPPSRCVVGSWLSWSIMLNIHHITIRYIFIHIHVQGRPFLQEANNKSTGSFLWCKRTILS